MLKKKKHVKVLCLLLGIAMFGVTAFADILSVTGYEQLKGVVKNTTKQIDDGVDGDIESYTFRVNIKAKQNDEVVFNGIVTTKFDGVNNLKEFYENYQYFNQDKAGSYRYDDAKVSIFHNIQEDFYRVFENSEDVEIKDSFNDPFKEERVKDLEKIFDALIGNLKEQVMVEEKSDGSRVFSGSLSESQIPTVINAIASYGFKQMFASNGMHTPIYGGGMHGDEEYVVSQLVKDVYVKFVNGKVVADDQGIFKNAYLTGALSGKDKDDISHNLSAEVMLELIDINKTVITKPDLTNKKVEISTRDTKHMSVQEKVISEMYVGKYNSFIIIEENNKFKKIGEKIVEIYSVDDGYVTGKYYETYLDGYDEYNEDRVEFDFKAVINNNWSASIENLEYRDDILNGGLHLRPENFDFGVYGKSGKYVQLTAYKGAHTTSSFRRVFED